MTALQNESAAHILLHLSEEPGIPMFLQPFQGQLIDDAQLWVKLHPGASTGQQSPCPQRPDHLAEEVGPVLFNNLGKNYDERILL